ncbi:cobalamin-binding protein [bacterium]|nr:cobalamin-binding protein [bacterium]MCI0602200.1 cobalamin-binding protein [bacterium]
MRIVSLLPSATEILFALGLGDKVVGVTHECDYPSEARSLPVLTQCVFDSEKMTQEEIDTEVKRLATAGESLYRINDQLLSEADPDLIVTQDLCHVCAITPGEVQRAVDLLGKKPEIVSLSPKLLEDVFADMDTVARSAGMDADGVIQKLHARVRRIAPAATLCEKPTVGCLEWLEPLWRTGHWIPGMVQLAGAEEVLAEGGKPSRGLSWEELQSKNPDIIILMPCGYNLGRAREEFFRVRRSYPWENLRAYQNQAIFVVDANSYFSRSGPRLVDGLEMLAEIFHPEYFANLAPLHSYVRFTV